MIWIVDNGGKYSDHAIMFVETSTPEEEAVVHAFVALPWPSHRKAFVLASAPELSWRGGAALTVAEAFAERLYGVNEDLPGAREAITLFADAWKRAGLDVGPLWYLESPKP